MTSWRSFYQTRSKVRVQDEKRLDTLSLPNRSWPSYRCSTTWKISYPKGSKGVHLYLSMGVSLRVKWGKQGKADETCDHGSKGLWRNNQLMASSSKCVYVYTQSCRCMSTWMVHHTINLIIEIHYYVKWKSIDYWIISHD